MKEKLKEITITKGGVENINIIKDKDILKDIITTKDRIFVIEHKNNNQEKNNPLLQIEIAIRKCERFGLFSK